MDGVETFHVMEDMPDNKSIGTPVIILTANAVIGAKEGYLKEGFDDFLSKPVEPSKLEKIIFETLPRELIVENEGGEVEEEGNTIDFPTIDGMDFAYGRIHFKSDEDLLESIELFYRVLKSEAEKLQEFYENIDTDNGINSYRIQVHSMKNAATLLGITTLSGMAKVLENAAANQERECITTLTPVFLKEWYDYRNKLEIIIKKDDEALAEYDANGVMGLLSELKEATETFDITQMDNLMEELNGYKYDEAMAEKMEQLSAYVAQFDIEKTIDMVDEIRKLL